MERKYGQRGYQDSDRSDRDNRSSAPKSPRADNDGPRSPNMMAFQGVLRCAMCGTNIDLIGDVDVDRTCAKCNADIRTCRNCTKFDPAARWECRADIQTHVLSKTSRTNCELFVPRRRVEKKTGESGRPGAANDAKSAFDKLFKK